MRRKLVVLLFLCLSIPPMKVPFRWRSVVSGQMVAPASARAQSDASAIRVLESDERHLLLELTLPPYDSEAVTHDGERYHRLRVVGWPSWGQPGEPQLPMYSVPLGLPALGTPQITVLEAEGRTIAGYRLHPMVRLRPAPSLELEGAGEPPQVVETFVLDPKVYGADAFYPGPLAEPAAVGFLRHQPIFQLRLYPFQYNPLRRELRVYRRLRVLVTFPEERVSLSEFDAQSSPVFERILEQSLLNYDALSRPASEAAQPSGSPGPLIAPLDVLDSGPRVKLGIEQAGLYRVTYGDLAAVAPELVQGDPRYLMLSTRGAAVPVLFEGESDGTFDAGDSFVFYGQAISSDYTRENVYWLKAGSQPGLRMTQRDGTPGAGSAPGAFGDTRRHEENHVYWRAVPNGEGKDHWFWSELSVSGSTPAAVDYVFDLHHIAAAGPDGELCLALHGATYGDHTTQLYLNDVALLSPVERAWAGKVEKLYQIPVSQSLFVEGTNHLRVESALPAGESSSEVYVNWFTVTYRDTYVAEDDRLLFSVPSAGAYAFSVTGFSTDAVDLLDITDPTAPVHIVNPTLEADGGGYRLRFNDSAAADQKYLARRADDLPTPSMQLDEPSAWKSEANGATYLIITHPSFYDIVQPLATHRAGRGETVAVVKTEDVYDEFSHGITDPLGIRSFLEYAYDHWSPCPVYVLLVGDASLDPKNNRGSSFPDLLPAYYVDTPLFGQTPNDSWYAKVHGDDDYPDLIVGRIPARYLYEVNAVVNKVQTYEGTPPLGGWMRRALLVADDSGDNFVQDMEAVAGMLPEGVTPVRMYDYDPSTSVQNEVSAGALLFAYSGHGSGSHRWATWSGIHRIFAQSQMWDLWNGDKLPFMTVANCLSGLFDEYDSAHAMAEQFLLLRDKGGIASWAPASYGFPTPNSLILEELYEALLVDGDLVLGSAATTARIQAHLSRPDLPLSLFEAFTYFGDPAVSLNLPATLELEGFASDDPVVMGDSLTYTLTYTVSHPGQARGLTLESTLPEGVQYQSASPSPSSIYGRTLTWHLGDMPAGSSTVMITARVETAGLSHGQIVQNEVHLYDATGGDQVIPIGVTVHDRPIAGLSAHNDGPTDLGTPTVLEADVASGSNVVYTWDFDDGSPPEIGASVQHTYPATGTYIARVTATNGVSSEFQTTAVDVVDVPPVASFVSSSPDRLGQVTTLQSTSAGTNLRYQWSFGDGSLTIGGQGLTVVTHAYTSLGSFEAVLTATNSAGTDVFTDAVVILEAVDEPVAGFTSSSPDELGQVTSFVNTSQDGGDDEENVFYTWNFGDGNSSAVRHPSHTYEGVGIYPVSLTITNSVGSDTIGGSVRVTDVPIGRLSLENDSPTIVGDVTAFSATVASGTNISYLWDLGDGTSSAHQYPTHVYGAAGGYGVVLTATNSAGSQVVTDTVRVDDVPIQGLSMWHDGPTVLGDRTTFTACITAGTGVSYLWDFGDGGTNTSQDAVHTYSAVGQYSVVLTATNSWGSMLRLGTVFVRNVVPEDPHRTLFLPLVFKMGSL